MMWSDFQAKKLITCRECELAANQAESENQAEPVPGPGPDKKNYELFFKQIKSDTMPVHHMKGQPAASIYVWRKGGVKKDSNHDAPCSYTQQSREHARKHLSKLSFGSDIDKLMRKAMSDSARNLCKICRLPVDVYIDRARKKLDNELMKSLDVVCDNTFLRKKNQNSLLHLVPWLVQW